MPTHREERVQIEPVSGSRISIEIGRCRTKATNSKPMLLVVENEGKLLAEGRSDYKYHTSIVDALGLIVIGSHRLASPPN
jgi:hypothetical protein